MREVRFPCLSFGYIGQSNKKETLNAKFFSHLLSDEFELEKKIYFPQRVPRKEFFCEIARLENRDWLALFHEKQGMILQKIYEQIGKSVDPIIFNNLLNFALRLGLCEQLQPFLSKLTEVARTCGVESELLVQAIALESALENEYDFDAKPLENLLRRVLVDNGLNSLSVVMVLTYGVVFYSRFKVSLTESLMGQVRVHLENKLKSLSGDFVDCLYASVALRGLPMLPAVSVAQKESMLNRAEQLARGLLLAKCDWKILLAKENLYTFLQTKSKWYFHQGKDDLAEICFEEMMELDPFDATVYSEYGFSLLQLNKLQQAEVQFAKSVELGPPGVSMHLYYQAYCLQLQNQLEKSIGLLQQSILLDEEAVSPYLDLLELYSKLNKKQEYRQIVEKLLCDEKLRSQLSVDEIAELHNVS